MDHPLISFIIKIKGPKFSTMKRVELQQIMNLKRNKNELIQQSNIKKVLSLRGGGCGTSQEKTTDPSFCCKINLHYDFLEKLQDYSQLLISKSQLLMNEQSSSNSIWIAIQWFHYNSEFINVCCQRGEYVKQVYQLFFNKSKDLLKVIPNYVKSSSFLAYRVLQIINELLRVLFCFQAKRKQRILEEIERDQLLELVEKIHQELDIELAEVWKTGIEFELSIIEHLLHNCNIDYSKGGGILIQIIENLVQSVGALKVSDNLIESAIEGAKYLFKAVYYKVTYPEEVYLSYFFFQTLKWKIIYEIKEKQNMDNKIKQLINGYQKHVEQTKNWIIHYSWIQMICEILSYRVVIYKDVFLMNQKNLSQQQKWNQLVENKLIKSLPYPNQVVIQLYNKNEIIDQEVTSILYSLTNIKNFEYFYDILMYDKLDNKINFWEIYANFNFEKPKVKKHSNESQLLYQKIGIDNYQNLKDLLKHHFEQIKNQKKVILSLIENFAFENTDLDLDQIQKQIQIKSQELWNYLLKFLYLIGETNEKYQLIYIQIELIQNFSEKKGFSDSLFQNSQEIRDKLSSNFINIIKLIQSYQINCLKIEIAQNMMKNDLKQQLEKVSFIDEQKNFDELIKQLNVFESFEKGVSQNIIKYFIDKKFTFEEIEIQYQKLIQKFKPLFENPVQQLYEQESQAMIQDQQNFINFTNLQILEYFTLETKKKIAFKFISLNLYKIRLSKFINMYQIIEQMANSSKMTEDFPRIKEILIKMLENIKNITFFLSQQQDVNEQQVIQILQECFQVLNQNLEIITSIKNNEIKGQESQQQFEFDKKEAINLISKLQQLILVFFKQSFQQKELAAFFTEIENHLIFWKEKNQNSKESLIQINQKVHNEQDSSTSLIKSFQQFERQLEDQKMEYKKILMSLQIEETIIKTNSLQLISSNQKKNDDIFQEYASKLNTINQKANELVGKIQILLDSALQENPNNDGLKEINEKNLLNILNGCCIEIDQFLNIDQNYYDIADQILKKRSQKSFFQSDHDYKVRESLVINLLKVQACVQEEKITKFVQNQIKQIWIIERDERVRALLKNKDLLEMQKKLFSQDLRSFSAQIQFEMKTKLDQLSVLEQEIRLEGNEEIRKKQQKDLQLAYQDMDQYIENITDMSAQMNIALVFLKEMAKDLKSIKAKIDALSDQLNSIADDVRKLRGKKYDELLQIRKKKVIQQAQQMEIDSVYVPLKTKEYDPITGKYIKNQDVSELSFLLVENFKDLGSKESLNGEINEFIWNDQTKKVQKDVLLLRGLAGSGKSRSATKIEEFLWSQHKTQSDWIPIFVSLPTIKNPKYHLFQQAMDSEYYNFDSTQIREFKEAIRSKKVKVIFIFDSYDEMKQEFINQNLISTNKFISEFEIESPGKSVKFIITTRQEILNIQGFRAWFYGSSLENLKEIKLIQFDSNQIENYLQKYVELSVKRKIRYLYDFMIELQEKNFDLKEFLGIWFSVRDIVDQSNQKKSQDSQMLFQENEEEIIIQKLKTLHIFKHLKEQQIITLRKDLQQLWSVNMFQKSLKNVNIDQLLTTPFMLEIVVQVLPSIVKRKSGQIDFKEEFAENLKKIFKKFRKSQDLVENYKKQEEDNEIIDDQEKKVQQSQNSGTTQVDQILEKLDSQKFFINFSITDKLDIKDQKIFLNKISYHVGEWADFVLVALKLKQYTVYEFYDSFIAYYHDQQISKLRQLGKIVNSEGFQDDVFTFSQSLALDFTINQLTQISYKQKGKLKFNFQGQSIQNAQPWEEKYFNAQDENQEYLKLIRSCVLLSVKGTSFSFVHKSIQEFLVAKYIVSLISQITFLKNQKQISQDDQKYLKQSLFNQNSFNISQQNYSGVVQILKEQLDMLKFVDNKLLQIVELSKNKDFIRAASNSIHILSARQAFLGGKDLKDLEINDTNLNALSFFGSDLQNSKFSNVCIDSCNFNFCNLANTQWDNIICSEKPYLVGHQNKVLVVEFSSDGKLLATGDSISEIIIWDVVAYNEITKFKHQQGIFETLSIKFFKNNQQLITGGGIYIKIWSLNLPQLTLQVEIQCHYENIIKLLISSNQKRMYSCDQSGYVILWNLDHIIENDNFTLPIDYEYQKNSTVDVKHRNFRIIEIEKVLEQIKKVQERKQQEIEEEQRNWAPRRRRSNSDSEQEIRQIRGNENVQEHESFIGENGEEIDYIFDIALSSNGKILFAIQKERISSYDIQGKKCINQTQINIDSKFSKLSISKDDNYLAAIFDKNFLFIFDVSLKTKFKLIYTESMVQKIKCFSFSPDSKFFSSLGNNMILHRNINQLQVDEEIKQIQNYDLIVFSNFDDLYVKILEKTTYLVDSITNQTISQVSHEKKVISAVFSRQPRNLIIGNDDDSIIILELNSLIQKQEILNAWNKHYQLLVSEDSRLSVNIQNEHFIIINLEKSDRQQNNYYCEFPGVQQIILQPKSFKIALAKKSNIVIMDLENPEENILEQVFNSNISCMNYSFQGQYLLVGFNDGAIRIINDIDKKQQDFAKLQQPIKSLALSSDNQILCAQANNQIFIWNFETKVEISQGKFPCETKLIFNPVNQILAYGIQQDIYFLNCQTLEQLKKYSHEKQVCDFTFSKDNKYLVSVDKSSTIILQNLQNSKITEIFLLKNEKLFKIFFINQDTFLTATHQIIRIWQIMNDDNMNLMASYYMEEIFFLNVMADNNQNIFIHSQENFQKIKIEDFFQEHINKIKIIQSFRNDDYPFAISKNWKLIGYCEENIIFFIKVGGYKNEFELDNQAQVKIIQFSNNEKLFCSYGEDNILKLWDLDAKQIVGQISYRQKYLKQIQFNESNENLFIQGKNLMIFNIKNFSEIKLVQSFNCQKYSTKNDQIALKCKNFCQIRKWKNIKEALSCQFILKKQSCNFTYSLNNYLGFVADCTLEIWSLKQQKMYKTIPNSGAFAFSQSEKHLAIQYHSIIRLINLENDEELSKTSDICYNHNIIYFVNDETIISTNLVSICQFNIQNNKLILVRRMKEKLKYSFVYYSTQAKFLCFSNKFTNKVSFINIEKFQQINYLDNPLSDNKKCQAMIINQDEKYLILEFNGSRTFYDLENFKQIKLNLGFASNLTFLNQNQILGQKDIYNEKSKLISFQTNDVINKKPAVIEFGQLASDIKCKSYSKQNNYFAYGGDDRKIYLWDVKGRAELQVFSGHSSQINSVEFSPNGELIASGGDDKLVRLWNVNAITNVKQGEGHKQQISCLAFSYDGLLLASGSEDGKIKIWSVKNKKYLKTLERHKTLIVKLEFSKDQSILISCDKKCYIIFWNIQNLNDISFKIIKNLHFPIDDFIWDSSRQILFSLNNIDTNKQTKALINIWNYEKTFEKNFEITIKLPGEVNAFTFFPNQQKIGCIVNGQLKIYDLKQKQSIILQNGEEYAQLIALSKDGKQIVTLNRSCSVNFWFIDDKQDWKLRRQINFKQYFDSSVYIHGLKFSPCEKKLYFLGSENFSSYDLENTQLSQEDTYIDFGLKEITCFYVEHHSNNIFLGHSSESKQTNDIQYLLSLFQIKENKFNKLQEFRGCQKKIKMISFSYQKEFVSAGDESGKIYVWNNNTSKLIFQSQKIDGEIQGLSFLESSENSLISWHQTLANNNKFQFYANFMIWNIKEQQNYQINISNQQKLKICQISQYGKYIALSYYNENVIRLNELDQERNAFEKDTIKYGSQDQLIIAFSVDQKFLFAGTGYFIFIRNIEKKENLWSQQLRIRASLLQGCFSLDGQYLLMKFSHEILFLVTLGKNHEIIDSNHYIMQKEEKSVQLSFFVNDSMLILNSDNAILNIKKENFKIFNRFYYEGICQNGIIFTSKSNLKKIISNVSQQVVLFPDESKFVITNDQKFCFSNSDELNSYSLSTQFDGHQNKIISVIISYNSAFMATMCSDQFIKLWNIQDIHNPKFITIFQDKYTKTLQFSMDSAFFSRSSYGTIKCIEIDNFQIPEEQVIMNERILGIQQQKQENSNDIFWFISETKLFFKEDITQQYDKICLTFPNKIHTYTFSKNYDKFAYSDLDGKIYQYQIEAQKQNLLQNNFKQSPTGHINSLCFSPNGKILLLGGQDGAIRVWDSKKEAQLFCLENQSDSIKCLAFNPNYVYFAAGFSDGSIGLYITNFLREKLDKEQHLIECLKKTSKIGCLKIFAQQSLFSAYVSNFENRFKNDKDDIGLAKLFSQKVGRLQKDIQEIYDVQ